MNLQGRSLLKETDLSPEEFQHLLTLAFQLREEKRMGFEFSRLARRNFALIFEKASTRTRSAFEVAAHESPASIVFGQAENRMHAIKARMLATIPDRVS